MTKQLLLPINLCEPSSFDEVKMDRCLCAIKWLENWSYNDNANLGCVVGKYASELATVWKNVNQAQVISNDDCMFYDFYNIMERKYKTKSYLMNEPELVIDEELFLHLINLIKECSFHLLFVSKTKPNKWSITLPDLKSRVLTINVLEC